MGKRLLDVALGSLLCVAMAPLIGVLAIATAVTLRAWPFFIQDRIGRHGRHFRFIKIRTMPTTAPRYGLKPEVRQLELPRLCRFLRARHLDELPQLFLVPLGHMSLVGPRPKMPDEHEPVDPHYAFARTQVRQGCTCLWQVGIATDGLPSEAPEYDYWYLRHGSVRLDLWILWHTALKVLGLGHAISLEGIPAWVQGDGWITPEVLVLPAEEAPVPAAPRTLALESVS